MFLTKGFIPGNIWIVFAALIFSLSSVAQEEARTSPTSDDDVLTESVTTAAEASSAQSRSRAHWAIELSTFQWNESLRVQQGILNSKDFANFNGLTLGAEKDFVFPRWGWSAGAFIGYGRATGGGNSSVITYQKDKVAYTIVGIHPRFYYRLSNRVSAGVTALVFIKNIDWPKEAATQTIDSGRNLNATALLDLKIRIFQKWDFYQGVGPLAEGSTLWKLGINYRF